MLLLAYLAIDYCFTVSLLFLSWCFPNTNLRNVLSLNPWIDGFMAEVGDCGVRVRERGGHSTKPVLGTVSEA